MPELYYKWGLGYRVWGFGFGVCNQNQTLDHSPRMRVIYSTSEEIMKKRLIFLLTAGLLLCFVSCKDKEEKAFKKEEKQVAKILSEEKPFILGTWVKDISGADSMPDIMVIKDDGKLAAYEDNYGGELGLDPKKEKDYSWKTEADFFIIDKGWETVTYLYKLEEKSMTFFDEGTREITATYTKK